MQMGADTRENTGSWPVVHGIGVSSLFVHGRVRPTQSRPYRYLTLYGTIVERVESGDTSGRITYTSTSQMHVRSASVIGHIHLGCRTRTIPVSILVTFRSPATRFEREKDPSVHAVGSQRGSISRSHPRISPAAALARRDVQPSCDTRWT